VLQEAITEAYNAETSNRGKKKKKPWFKWTLKFRSSEESATRVARINPNQMLRSFEKGEKVLHFFMCIPLSKGILRAKELTAVNV
jgi:hypothetical protein